MPVINKKKMSTREAIRAAFKLMKEWDKKLAKRIVSGEVQSNILEIMEEHNASNIKQADED